MSKQEDLTPSNATSRRMKSTRRRDTEPEMKLRKELHRRGLRYRLDLIAVVGIRSRPDLVFKKDRLAVYIDGCFWHGCPAHGTYAKRNVEYWSAKITSNRDRDERATRDLRAAGWIVMRIWEHEDPSRAADFIEKLVRERRHKNVN